MTFKPRVKKIDGTLYLYLFKGMVLGKTTLQPTKRKTKQIAKLNILLHRPSRTAITFRHINFAKAPLCIRILVCSHNDQITASSYSGLTEKALDQ